MSELALPEGWAGTTLEKIAKWGAGGTPSRKNKEYFEGDIPWIKTGDLGDRIISKTTECITELAIANSSAKIFKKGSVALAMYGATIGKTSIIGMDSATNQACAVGEPNQTTSSDFLYYLLKNEKLNFISKGKGGAQPNISQTTIKSHEIYLPALAEQSEIVRFLDTNLTTVSQIQARLDAIPKLIEKFRQSVLNDAVSGRLTEEWRKDKRYQKLDSYEIPTCWTMLSIEDIADVKGGKRLPKGEKLVEFDTGYPYIRAGQLKLGTVVNTDEARSSQKYLLAETQKQIENYIVKENDAYITIVGASIGDAGLIPKSSSGANLTENAAKLTNYKKELNPVFLSFWLRSAWIQHKIRLQIKSGAQGKLALHRIKSLPFVYPTYEEQNKIVQKVEQFFAYADQIEKSAAIAKARVDHLTQSILHQAFTGNLTAEWREQNPNLISGENSAEALLAKIKSKKQGSAKKMEQA